MINISRRNICRSLAALSFASFPRISAGRQGLKIRNNDDSRNVFLSDIPDSPGSVILGRPTDHSITLSVLWQTDTEMFIQYGQENDRSNKSRPFSISAANPQEILLTNLQSDTLYSYRIIDAQTSEALLPIDGAGIFRTQRAVGESFIFTIQADSHLDGDCLLPLYERTIQNALDAKPDFHIDLGDTFMTGKIPSRADAAKQYVAQRHWLGRIGHSAPVFLVIGNHDGEETSKQGSTDEGGLAIWSCLQRKHYFPNPVPGNFYKGNIENHQYAGVLQNYYAWEWGDALFVVLDPYWYSASTRGGTEPWNMTIGKTQYDWLAKTLRISNAKHKFIFIHQLVGGLDRGARGGAEAAVLYEWGGHEKNGDYTFNSYRPGWEQPIHSLLKETGVTVVFHGHDHFYAKQELDGIIYQLVPQPAHRNNRNHHAEEYGYKNGEFIPNSGHLRVKVNPDNISIDYIRTFLEPSSRIKNWREY